MIFIANLDNLRMAQAFIDYMMGLGIKCTLRPETDGCSIWISNSDQEAQTLHEFTAFTANPNDDKYLAASWNSANPQISSGGHSSANNALLANFLSHGGPVTLIVFGLALLIYLTGFLGSRVIYDALAFFQRLDGESLMQTWRLITPALLHFSLMHIVFNLMWWWQLGGEIERRLSSGKLLLLFLLGSSLPNLLQFFIAGANFGGLSGVVYALLGYVWWSAKLNPKSGLTVTPAIVGFMLIWLVLGFFDIFGLSIANGAHVGGLVVGCVQAWFDRDRSLRHFQR